MAKNRNNDRINEDITPKNVVDNEFFENASVSANEIVEPEVQEQPKKQPKKQEQPVLRKFLKFNK